MLTHGSTRTDPFWNDLLQLDAVYLLAASRLDLAQVRRVFARDVCADQTVTLNRIADTIG